MRIWIDITNSPHVLFFRPIIAALTAAGHDVVVTARDYAQTVALLDQAGILYTLIGRHRGSCFGAKAFGLITRATRLALFGWLRRFDVAFGHNSNDLAVAAWLLRIPQMTVFDYEHAGLSHKVNSRFVTRILVPEAIPVESILAHGAKCGQVGHFPGLKEHVYLSPDMPWINLRSHFGVADDGVLAVVRPPATMSAYHRFGNPLFDCVLERLGAEERAVIVVVPRTGEQRASLLGVLPPNALMPDEVFDAVSLIKSADLVISAGGTMNREAVVLGTPAYTIFAGEPGAVDMDLIRRGLMVLVEEPEDIVVRRKDTSAVPAWWVDNQRIIIKELMKLVRR